MMKWSRRCCDVRGNNGLRVVGRRLRGARNDGARHQPWRCTRRVISTSCAPDAGRAQRISRDVALRRRDALHRHAARRRVPTCSSRPWGRRRRGRTSRSWSCPARRSARAAEAKRRQVPIVYIQAQHSRRRGRRERKRCSRCCATCRATATRNVLDSLVIVAVPIYNADGNDAIGPQERTRRAERPGR